MKNKLRWNLHCTIITKQKMHMHCWCMFLECMLVADTDHNQYVLRKYTIHRIITYSKLTHNDNNYGHCNFSWYCTFAAHHCVVETFNRFLFFVWMLTLGRIFFRFFVGHFHSGCRGHAIPMISIIYTFNWIQVLGLQM